MTNHRLLFIWLKRCVSSAGGQNVTREYFLLFLPRFFIAWQLAGEIADEYAGRFHQNFAAEEKRNRGVCMWCTSKQCSLQVACVACSLTNRKQLLDLTTIRALGLLIAINYGDIAVLT